jgi:hypothetical protein
MVFMEFYAEIHNNLQIMPGNNDIIPEWACVPSEEAQHLTTGYNRTLGPRGLVTDGQWNATIDWMDEDISFDESDEESDEESEESDEESEESEEEESEEEESEEEESEEEDSGEDDEEFYTGWPPIDLTNIEWLPPSDIEEISITIN